MTDTLWRDDVLATLAAGVSVDVIARKFGCSMPVVRRWANGRSSPHPIMQVAMRKSLEALRASAVPAQGEDGGFDG